MKLLFQLQLLSLLIFANTWFVMKVFGHNLSNTALPILMGIGLFAFICHKVID